MKETVKVNERESPSQNMESIVENLSVYFEKLNQFC